MFMLSIALERAKSLPNPSPFMGQGRESDLDYEKRVVLRVISSV
jgi:hypothetical protein